MSNKILRQNVGIGYMEYLVDSEEEALALMVKEVKLYLRDCGSEWVTQQGIDPVYETLCSFSLDDTPVLDFPVIVSEVRRRLEA